MPILRKRAFLRISPGAYLGLCVLLLVFPVKWVLSWMIAAAIHESAHILILSICRVRILSVKLNLSGAGICTEPAPPWKELLSAMAGPLSGILLLCTARRFPQLAVCAFFQTVLNLIPVRQFDGGRAVNCLLRLFLRNDLADLVSTVLEWAALLIVVCFGLYAFVRYDTGILLPAVAAVFLLRRMAAKIPCKPGKQIVQCTQPNIRGRKHE